MRLFYKIAANLLGPFYVLFYFLRGRFGGQWRERLGLIKNNSEGWQSGRRYWFHGASVGEVHTAAAIISSLLEKEPDAEIILSIGTPLGLQRAKERYRDNDKVTVMASPLEFWGATKRYVERLKPKALVIVETELWPHMIEAVSQSPARLILAAGRMTPRSFKGYCWIKKFMARLLAKFDLLAMATSADAERLEALGAPLSRIKILGTPKYDQLQTTAYAPGFQERALALQKRLWVNPGQGQKVLVAGSTHQPEETTIFEAYKILLKKYPDLVLVLAPRHVKRATKIVRNLGPLGGSSCHYFSRPVWPLFNGPGLLILDKTGYLESFYALADVSVVGGSLFGGHGHNPLEPVVHKSPMLFGSFMDSFTLEAEGLLACGGAIELPILDTGQMPVVLAEKIDLLLSSPELAQRQSQAAFDFLQSCPRRAPKLAEAILNL